MYIVVLTNSQLYNEDQTLVINVHCGSHHFTAIHWGPDVGDQCTLWFSPFHSYTLRNRRWWSMHIVVLTISQLYIEDQTLVINVHCGSHHFTAIHWGPDVGDQCTLWFSPFYSYKLRIRRRWSMYIVVLTISQLYIEDQTLVINVHCGSHHFTAIHWGPDVGNQCTLWFSPFHSYTLRTRRWWSMCIVVLTFSQLYIEDQTLVINIHCGSHHFTAIHWGPDVGNQCTLWFSLFHSYTLRTRRWWSMCIVVLTISQLYIEDQTLVINVHCGSHHFTAIHWGPDVGDQCTLWFSLFHSYTCG